MMTCLCRNVLRNKVVMFFYLGKVFQKSGVSWDYFDTMKNKMSQ